MMVVGSVYLEVSWFTAGTTSRTVCMRVGKYLYGCIACIAFRMACMILHCVTSSVLLVVISSSMPRVLSVS